MDRKSWTLEVYKADRRFKTGEMFAHRYNYHDKTYQNMIDELTDLRRTVFINSKWRLHLREEQ